MKHLLKFVKNKTVDQDLYGHPVELNFNKKGKTHKTLIGGFASLIVLAIYYYYIGLNLKKLFWRESDSVSIDMHELENYDLQDLSINNTDMITFFIISK